MPDGPTSPLERREFWAPAAREFWAPAAREFCAPADPEFTWAAGQTKVTVADALVVARRHT
jgi:hypothetical protein